VIPIELPPNTSDSFRATATQQGTTATLALFGNADAHTLGHVQAAVGAMRDAARARRFSEVSVDMRQLEFMNSSCFKCLITWLSDLLEQPAEQRYRIRFLSDPGKHWQHRSLRALSCFAVDLVSIETPEG
jgi:hypothetical protein